MFSKGDGIILLLTLLDIQKHIDVWEIFYLGRQKPISSPNQKLDRISFRICLPFLPVKTIKIGFLGSGPDRGRSPVEWGDFPFVRSSVRSSAPPSGPASQA